MKTKGKFIAAFKIWIIIYPLITLFLHLFGKPLSGFPLYQRTLFLTVFLVPVIVFIGLPFLDFLISLYRPENKSNS